MYATFWEWAQEPSPEPFLVPAKVPGNDPGCRLFLNTEFPWADNPTPFLHGDGVHIHNVLETNTPCFQVHVLMQKGLVLQNTNMFWNTPRPVAILDLITVHLPEDARRFIFEEDYNTDYSTRRVIFDNGRDIIYPEISHKLLHTVEANNWARSLWYNPHGQVVIREKIPNWILL